MNAAYDDRMDKHAAQRDLEAVARASHFVYESAQLVTRWEEQGMGVDAAEPILRFLEAHPNIDFGSPGPLVHFLEAVLLREREGALADALVASLRRRPVSATTWMLNRLLNVTDEPKHRAELLAELERIIDHEEADAHVAEEAREFLDWQRD